MDTASNEPTGIDDEEAEWNERDRRQAAFDQFFDDVYRAQSDADEPTAVDAELRMLLAVLSRASKDTQRLVGNAVLTAAQDAPGLFNERMAELESSIADDAD